MGDVGRAYPARQRWGAALILAFVCAFVPVIYLCDPAKDGIFPPCIFREVTGLKCPGCGSMRALHHLAHGEVLAAFRLNPLMVLALPLAAWFVASNASVALRGRPLKGIKVGGACVWGVFALVIIYTVLRNIFSFFGG